MKQIYQLLSSRKKKARNSIKGVVSGLAILCTSYIGVNAQVSAYTFSQTNGTYTPITGATVLGTATGNASATNLNSNVYPVTLPFNFNFNGANYSALNVSTNGYVTFGATAPGTTTAAPISGTLGYNGAISAFGRDINSVFNVAGVTGDITWTTVGTAPNREVVIQWKDFRPANSTSTTNVYTFSFQIRLKETSNAISVVYNSGGNIIGFVSSSATAQIGLRGETNADFNTRTNLDTVEFFNSTAGTANNSAQEYSTVNAIPGMPAAGLTYMWTPPTCWRPSGFSNPTSTVNTVDVQWTAPLNAPASGYEIYYNTTGTEPTNATAALITGVTTTSATIPSLNSSTTYYVWIRSVCSSSDKSNWSAVGTAKTLCGPMTSMFENFDSYATGNIVPDCWARIVGASNTAQTISSTSPSSGTRNLYQITSTAANATVVVLPEFSNVNAGTHWLRFKARVASGNGSLDVGYVSNITDASTFVNIQTISVLNTSYTAQDSEYTVIIPNTVPSNARLAIRNNGASTVGHYYDDVYWEPKPSCISPTNITISNITPTTAQVQWTASVTPPAAGYDVYYSTSETMPTSSTTPSVTGVTTLSTPIGPLTPSTKYYVWVRSRCSTSDLSNWSTQIVTFYSPCQPPAILSSTPATICPNSTATLSATADTGATITWYDAPTGGNILTTGNSYTTPNLSSTTNYYVSALVSSPASVGEANPSALTNAGTTTAGTTFYIEATVSNTPITVQSVDVFPSAAGNASFIRVYLGTATTPVYEIPFTSNVASGGTIPQTIPLNIILNPGVYRFKIEGAGSYYRNYNASGGVGQSFPYGQGDFTLTGGSNVTTGYYLFYNFIVGNTCESARTQVTATVDSNCLSTSEVSGKENIKVYPNPFSEVVNINKPELVKSIKVSDVSGKLLKTINQPESVLRLTDLSQGMYILLLEMKDGSRQSIKVIKK